MLNTLLLSYGAVGLLVFARYAYFMSTLDRYDWACHREKIWVDAILSSLLWPLILARPKAFLNPREFLDPLDLAGITRRAGLNLDAARREEKARAKDPAWRNLALTMQLGEQIGRRLEPSGFRRERTQFVRERDGFTERYALFGGPNIEGRREPFRLQAGMWIEGIPRIPNWKGFGVHVHALGSTAAIVPGTPVMFELVSAWKVRRVAKEMVAAILATSERMPEFVPIVRLRAESGVGSKLPGDAASS